jgi:hypothetical protein
MCSHNRPPTPAYRPHHLLIRRYQTLTARHRALIAHRLSHQSNHPGSRQTSRAICHLGRCLCRPTFSCRRLCSGSRSHQS